VSITNKDELRDKIHSIHNFLRNHGAGYGMNALKVFNIVYGLYKIEKNYLFEMFKLDEVCRYSTLLEHANQVTANNNANSERDLLHRKFFGHGEYKESGGVLDILYEHEQLKNILFYEIPKNMTADTLVQLFKEIKSLEEVENRSNVQLAGKIYEYFIGRDNTAISELGAYFTDRNITDFIFREVAPVRLSDDGTVPEMIDPFGGSGGFTISYAREMLRQAHARHIAIDWDTQLANIHHYDMNEDVIRSAALELLCMTGSLPIVANHADSNDNQAHMGYKNSFKDEFKDHKFPLIYTNPPYGGDDNKGTNIKKRKKLIKHLTDQLKDKTAEFSDECRNAKSEQIKQLKKDNIRDENEQKSNSVSLETSSKRVQHYAKHYGGFNPPPMQTKSKKKPSGLTGKDKEAVSLLMLMDMLAPSGTAVGVLKEGVFFNAKYKTLRAQLLTNYNVREIVSIPNDAFENTTTKTSILVFDAAPEGETICTDTVRFSEIVVEKYTEDKITELADGTVYLEEAEGDVCNIRRQSITEASYAQIATQKDWALDAQKYQKEETVLKAKEGWEMVALGEVCDIKSGKFITAKQMKGGKYAVIGGGKIRGHHNESNCSANSIVISRVGDFHLLYHTDPFFLTDNAVALMLKSVYQDRLSQQILYNLIQCVQEQIMVLYVGSAQKALARDKLKAFKIPLPKTHSLRTHWTTRVSTPYTAKQNAEKRIVELEATVRGMVKEVVEMEGGCEWVALGEVCEYIKTGKNTCPDKKKGTLYPYYGTGGITGWTDTYLFDGPHLLIARNGTIGNCFLTYGRVYPSDHIFVLKSANVEYIYWMIQMLQSNLQSLSHGSVIAGVTKTDLKAFKIPLPKDPSFQAQLQPHFDELDALRQQVKTHEAEYKQALVELREAALEE
jgi:type I restriction-modification system DNA methylase subunit